ncbi:hypothetical protein F5887DRAFT_1173076 [Amanita rubescens]|nr:hypothetical protein F5887DRAFT_1173076 [Amanita rubescens]
MDPNYQPPSPPQFWIIGVVVVSILGGITLFLAFVRASRRRQLVAVTLSGTPRRVESGFNRNLIIDQPPPPPAYTRSPPPPVYPAGPIVLRRNRVVALARKASSNDAIRTVPSEATVSKVIVRADGDGDVSNERFPSGRPQAAVAPTRALLPEKARLGRWRSGARPITTPKRNQGGAFIEVKQENLS